MVIMSFVSCFKPARVAIILSFISRCLCANCDMTNGFFSGNIFSTVHFIKNEPLCSLHLNVTNYMAIRFEVQKFELPLPNSDGDCSSYLEITRNGTSDIFFQRQRIRGPIFRSCGSLTTGYSFTAELSISQSFTIRYVNPKRGSSFSIHWAVSGCHLNLKPFEIPNTASIVYASPYFLTYKCRYGLYKPTSLGYVTCPIGPNTIFDGQSHTFNISDDPCSVDCSIADRPGTLSSITKYSVDRDNVFNQSIHVAPCNVHGQRGPKQEKTVFCLVNAGTFRPQEEVPRCVNTQCRTLAHNSEHDSASVMIFDAKESEMIISVCEDESQYLNGSFLRECLGNHSHSWWNGTRLFCGPAPFLMRIAQYHPNAASSPAVVVIIVVSLVIMVVVCFAAFKCRHRFASQESPTVRFQPLGRSKDNLILQHDFDELIT